VSQVGVGVVDRKVKGTAGAARKIRMNCQQGESESGLSGASLSCLSTAFEFTFAVVNAESDPVSAFT
jgi:hypothetical protein